MHSAAALQETVKLCAPLAVLQFTLIPALLRTDKTPQPFRAADTSYPLPPLDFVTSGEADVSVMLTSHNDLPNIHGDISVRRVGTMHVAPFAPRVRSDMPRVHSFKDLRKFSILQRADYLSVPSMEAWNEVCEDAPSITRFDGSSQIYGAFKASESITIFPNYSHMYDKEIVRLDADDLPDISLSVWMSSKRDMLKEPAVRSVFDTVANMFSGSPWFS